MRRDEYIKFRASREEVECLEDLMDLYGLEDLSKLMRVIIREKLEEEGYF